MLVFPNAKINLGLNIIEKRPDGFHSVESIMYPIGLKDVLEFIPAGKVEENSIFSTGLDTGASVEANLIMRAYQILKSNFDLPLLNIHLHKVIPIGAGLGGGSSNASFMLKALNEGFRLGLSHDELEGFAARIGSDCPFFIRNQSAFSSGRGEQLSSIRVNLKGYYLVLVHPGVHVGTKWAYSKIKPKRPVKHPQDVIRQDIISWKEFLVNDFEHVVFAEFPIIEQIKNDMYKHGAVYASMSGSGSAVYGLFESKPELGDVFSGNFVWEERL
ncbi:MAG: 4-(cytidine 5'-diphospho)-2-C-methyl-D-erythritol kinase [Bacteroidales bacterium]|nr:4-(cytidine 5'-diphospho)-2-C-methyl-D-erythritol kinase [Bacteroidales bacterium]MCF8456962.1 4-(cytidine 5'-diphospho)-2-C-methyl-D-erythritol kinase [Bacteroidales bacterium]